MNQGELGATMTSSKPYLLRAIHQWIVDNDLTPHLLVDAEQPDVVVPQAFVEHGKIVLNTSPSATRDLYLGDEAVMFSARFSGQPMNISIPMAAVQAIYAKENGQGMMFADDAPTAPDGDDDQPAKKPDEKPKRPALKVVK